MRRDPTDDAHESAGGDALFVDASHRRALDFSDEAFAPLVRSEVTGMHRLIVHGGLHKTGTTAFQQWVTDHVASIRAAGIHVPSVGTMDAGNHRPLIECLLNGDDAHVAREFNRAMPPTGDLLITSEWLTSPRGLSGVSYLAGLADRFGMEKQALLVIRDEAELLASWYVQLRQNLQLETPDYGVYVRRVRRQGRFDLPAILRVYTQAGFHIDQVPYASAERDGIVATLARRPVFGGRLDSLIPPLVSRENSSAGELTLIACDLVREASLKRGIALTPAVRRTLWSSIAATACDLPHRRFDPSHSPLTLDDVSEPIRGEILRVADVVVAGVLPTLVSTS